MNKLFVNNIGDLAEAPRASFYRFLHVGISEELKQLENPFVAKMKFPGKKKKLSVLVYLFIHDIKIKGPLHDLDSCLKKGISYTIQLYVGAEYSYPLTKKQKFNLAFLNIIENLIPKHSKAKKIKKTRIQQDIFFAEIPLITNEGTFFINGSERVVISQIIRSPGIYFKKDYGSSVKKKKYTATATIISNKGLWTKFVLTPEHKEKAPHIYLKLKEFKKQAHRSTEEKKAQKIEEQSDNNKLFICDVIKYFGLNSFELSDSVQDKSFFLEYQLENFAKSDYENTVLIESFFANQRSGCFSIGEIGRYKINKKLGLNLPKHITYLTAQDFIGILNGLIELTKDERGNDDIDDLRNKLVRSVGELLQNHIRVGIFRIQKHIVPNTNSGLSINLDLTTKYVEDYCVIDPRPLTLSLRDFFKTSQLSQFMDQINPLAELTHKRRISVFGPNGLQRDHISTVIRDIHPSQYGRLCPIETPEGQNAGLINAIALFSRINSFGSLETPYFFMNKGTIYSTKNPIYLNPDQEVNLSIAFGDVTFEKMITQKQRKDVQNTDQIKQPLEIEEQYKKQENKYISIKENYLFSLKKLEEINFITISPLQIVSLATALIPFLEHDDANRALMGSNMQRQAVPLLYTQKPIIGTGLESIAIHDSGMIVKTYCEGKVIYSSSKKLIIKDLSDQSISYYLRKYIRSNQETCINQKPIVWSGEKVFSGQIIADGPSTNDGELSLGRNLLIAYMPWEGYNYEDAIVISERIILDDCLTSVHIEEIELNITSCLLEKEQLTQVIPFATRYSLRHVDKAGIVKLGSYVKENDILIGKTTLCTDPPSPEKRLYNAIMNIPQDEKVYRDTSLRVPHGTEGRVIDIRIFSTLLDDQNFDVLKERDSQYATMEEIVRISIAQLRRIQVGDKLAGRHGNKGIVSRILARHDMPYLPDGTPIDIIFNPLGVPSRMNVGQVFESLLGLAAEKLGNRFKIIPFDEIYGKEASRILVNQKLKEASILTNINWLFNSYYPGKVLLRDGRTGEYFDNPITIGKSYILKLIHLVEDKIHARSIGPYALITEQPLAGKSQNGGQRFGEMEVWALEAYGCSNTLQELLTIKSDDIDGRNDMYEAIMVRKQIEKPNPGIPEAFLTLIRELHSLGLDFSLNKISSRWENTKQLQQKQIEIFKDIEIRLQLRTLLVRQNIEQFYKSKEENKKAQEKKKTSINIKSQKISTKSKESNKKDVNKVLKEKESEKKIYKKKTQKPKS